jgi:hypothetical protein
MKKKASTRPPISVNRRLGPLIEQVRILVQSARQAAATSVNALQVLTNFGIGRLIVEHEQQGQYRAAYGKETLVHLSASLTAEFGRGFSRANLEYMRKFYLLWQDRAVQISQKPSGKLPSAVIGQTPSGKSPAPFTLSWSPLRLAPHDQKSRRTLLLRNRGHAVRLVTPGTQASVKFRPIRASRAQP